MSFASLVWIRGQLSSRVERHGGRARVAAAAALVVACAACAHPMHVDAAAGADVYLEGKHAGRAPLDVEVPAGSSDIRLAVVDGGKRLDVMVERNGFATSTALAAAAAGASAAVVTFGGIGAWIAYLLESGSGGDFYAAEGASVLLFGCTPYLCAGAAGVTAAAFAAPLMIAGEEPPARVHVDVERGQVEY